MKSRSGALWYVIEIVGKVTTGHIEEIATRKDGGEGYFPPLKIWMV
jgi:hypothetical protein